MAIYFFLWFWLKLRLMVIDVFWSQKDFVIYKQLLYTSGVFYAFQTFLNGFIIQDIHISITYDSKNAPGVVRLFKLRNHLEVTQNSSTSMFQ